MSRRPMTAMVLAAGVGRRMRPLTDAKPKALVEVGGKALIDHALDPLAEAGVVRAVVNVHAFAGQLTDHLSARRGPPEIVISDESDRLLETGGGIRKARAALGEDPIFVLNSDYVWPTDGEPPLETLARSWEAERMDALLTVVPKAQTLGFDTPGDFFIDPDGRLTHRGERAAAPLHAFGVSILDPRPVYAHPQAAFSLFRTWMAAQVERRLFGAAMEGFWMQVGDPAALAAAEARLREPLR